MNWHARRKLFDLVSKFIYVFVLCASAFVGGMLIREARASSYDDVYTPVVTFRAGDLISLPNRKGTYIMALWGEQPVYYDGTIEWFTYNPVRNYQTVYVDVTRTISEGDYQFLEIEVAPGGSPSDLTQWRWVREYKARIIKCDQFKYWNDAECTRSARR